MPEVANYIKANDNAGDYSDALIVNLESLAHQDIDRMFTDASVRDADLWAEFDTDSDTVMVDYESVPDDQRDIGWALGLAGLSASATTQFFLDNREETIIKPVAYREQALGAFTLTTSQLVQAGKRGAEFVSEARFFQLRAQYLDDLSFLKTMDNVELYNTLIDYGAMQPADKMITAHMDYVSRMTNHRPGSPQFKAAVNDLIDRNSTRALKGMNRQAVQSIYSYREAGGDMATLMVWIGEGGKRTCEFCLANFGVVKPYGQWVEDGMPGMDVCAGGSLCRCVLSAA